MIRNQAIFTVGGEVEVFHFSREGWIPAASFHNDVQDTGADVMARSLYAPVARINTMYILFCSGEPPYLNTTAGNLTADGLRGITNVNCMRVPVMPIKRNGSVLQLQGISDGGRIVKPSPALTDSSSRIFAVGLVQSPDEEDPSQDVLFSAANIKTGAGVNTYITKVANAQVGILWTVTIGLGA